jgi:cell division protein ZapE
VSELYAREVAQRGFRTDPAQLSAVERLDELRSRLSADQETGNSAIRRWIERLSRNGNRGAQRGLYLWGGVGRGKTWLMDLFFHSLPFAERRRRHFHRFMHDVHRELKTLQGQRTPLELVADDIARTTRVLCFDELFVSDIADAMILGGLLGALFRRGVTLVATSNVSPADLYRDGLQRERFLPAIALLERHTEVLEVAGDTDYRLRTLAQAGTYLVSSAPDTQQRLERLFFELADHHGEPGGTLEIEGRPIPVVRHSEGTAWFAFTALCAGPRSQADYIEIAREYQSLIVSDVPVFTANSEDEARRFIALVDELYDRNVNLIVSAAAAAGELYRGRRLGLEFRRTASRLIEMQSQDYLAREHRP